MNKRFRRKKKGSKISIIIFIIIVGIFCSYMLISVFSNKVSDIFMSYAESETTKLMTLVINKSVTKQMANSFDDKLLFDIVKDAAGNIKLIDFNSLEVNKTLNMITNLKTTWFDMDFDEQRRIIEHLIDKVVVNDNEINIYYNIY